jgi:hypothetical protein
LRQDVHYRLIDSDHATSPIILNHRVNDNSVYVDLVKQLVKEMYAEPQTWLPSKKKKS